MERFWLKSYPPGVPADIDLARYASLVQLMAESFAKYAGRTAYAFMGRDYTFAEIDRHSAALGAWLRTCRPGKGCRSR